MKISLEPGQVDLLQAVAAGKVARHRMSLPEGPARGQDLEAQDPTTLGLAHRRAATRIDALRRLKLVELQRGEKTDRTWPWQLTEAGRTALEDIRERAETTATDQP
jgi:hypothetical protein